MDKSLTGGASLSNQANGTFACCNSEPFRLGRAGSGHPSEYHRRMLKSRRANDNTHPDRLS